MIIPLDKLLQYRKNRYIFTRANMLAVDRIANMDYYPEKNLSWKTVPNVLKITLEEQVKFTSDVTSLDDETD